MKPDDAELLKRWREGDRDAGNELYERYFDSLDRFFSSKLEQGAEDLIHETFMACMERRDKIVKTEKFRSYLFSVAYNKLKDYLRRRYRRGEPVDLEKVSMYMLEPGSSPSSLVAKRDDERLIWEALYRMPVRDQTLMGLYFWESLTTKEIGKAVDMPVGTVRTRLRTARRDMEKLIRELAKSTRLRDSTLLRFREREEERRKLFLEHNGEEEDGEEAVGVEDGEGADGEETRDADKK